MVVSYGIHTIRHTRLTFHIHRMHTQRSQNINKEASQQQRQHEQQQRQQQQIVCEQRMRSEGTL